jgi:hypothetical protein
MEFLFSPAWLKSLSALFINISAAWFMAAALTPNFAEINQLNSILVLMYYIFSGIMYLLLTVKTEEILQLYE